MANEEKIFTVITSNTKKVFNTTATTVGELKADLNAIGISTDGMAIQEGLTKTTFTSDQQLLPTNVPYKGTTTSNLVLRVTKAEKNIASGAMSRAEVYAKIKSQNLQDAVAEKFGKNYTLCKTDELVSFVESYSDADAVKPTEVKSTAESTAAAQKLASLYKEAAATVNSLNEAINVINDIVEELKSTRDSLEGIAYSHEDSPYTNEEIDDLFDGFDD